MTVGHVNWDRRRAGFAARACPLCNKRLSDQELAEYGTVGWCWDCEWTGEPVLSAPQLSSSPVGR